MPRFPPSLTFQTLRLHGLSSGKMRPSSGIGKGPAMVCQTVGVAPRIPCGAVQDLCRCLKPLIERDDLLDALMLEVVGEEPVASQTLTGKAMLLGEDPESQEE